MIKNEPLKIMFLTLRSKDLFSLSLFFFFFFFFFLQTEQIAKSLVRKHQTARVVLLLVFDMDLVSDLLVGTAKYVPKGTFIWVGSDGINPLLITPAAKPLYRGAFNVDPSGTMIPAFQDYYRNLTLVCERVYLLMHGDNE